MASGLWSWDSDSPWGNSEPKPYISSYTLKSLNPLNPYIPNYSSSYPLGSYGPPLPNNFSYAQLPGSPFLNLPPLPSNYHYPIGGRPQVPYYSLDEPLYGHDNTKNPYAPDALWNLNWDLEDTDIALEMPDDGESITVDIGETIGFILPNHADNYDADIEWVLDDDELDESIVEKINDERFPGYWYHNGWSQPVFKDGVEQWIFKAIGLGTTNIKLDCINREDDNTGTIEVEIKVTN